MRTGESAKGNQRGLSYVQCYPIPLCHCRLYLAHRYDSEAIAHKFVVKREFYPTDSCDINVSPDKRTILLHSENNLIESLKVRLGTLTITFRPTSQKFPGGADRRVRYCAVKLRAERDASRARSEGDGASESSNGRG